MLKSMVFKNFINFKDLRTIRFDNKLPHIFIGGNSTGKSSVFELIRRCMSSDINATRSSIYDKEQNAYVFCTFEPNDEILEIYPQTTTLCSGIIQIHESEVVKILWIDCKQEGKSKLIVLPIGETWKEVGKVKVFSANKKIGNDQTEMSTIIRRITEIDYDESEWSFESNKKRKKGTMERKENLKKVKNSVNMIIDYLIKDTNLEQNIEALEKSLFKTLDVSYRQIIDKTLKISKKLTEKVFEVIASNVLKALEKAFVATFPQRSIGGCQWSQSNKLAPKFQDTNYIEATQRAEIINALEFGSEIEPNDKINKDKADEIFNFITYPSEFVFSLKDKKIVKKNETVVKKEIMVKDRKSDKEFHLLKTPEGIIEARQFSLLMALKNVKTICFEEPDRGMHPQYIERMREVLIKHCDRKCVMLVTHNQYLINTRTAENTYVFFRKPEEKQKTPYDFKSIRGLNRHMTDVDEMKKVVFASKVLFVEGKTDKIVMEGIYEYLSTRSDKDHNTVSSIISRQIVIQGSCDKPHRLPDFCKGIHLDALWLTDSDKELSNYEKNYGFQWDNGAIEHVIINDLKKDQFKEIFNIDGNNKDDEYVAKKMKKLKLISKISVEKLKKLSKYLMESETKEKQMCRFVEYLELRVIRTD